MPSTQSPSGTLARAALALAILLAAAAPEAAQISSATIQGKVTDQTGILPGVTVTARETDSGLSRDATTDAEGRYTLAGLRPGTYEIRVTLDQIQAAGANRHRARRPDAGRGLQCETGRRLHRDRAGGQRAIERHPHERSRHQR